MKKLATQPVEAPGAGTVIQPTDQTAVSSAGASVSGRPEVQPPGPTTADQPEDFASEDDQFSDQPDLSLDEKGELSEVLSLGPDREELIEMDQELSAEQTYRETLRGVGVAGKRGQIRGGTQTSFQLRRLPVRLDRGQGQTHPRTLADPSTQNTGDLVKPNMSDLEFNVPDRAVNCHRKAGTFGQATHETHTVASQEQLESTRNTVEDHPHPKVTPPTPKMVAGGKQCCYRSSFTPSSTCSANIYRHIKRRVGRSLKRVHGKGKLVTPRKQIAHKLPRVKSSFSGFKRIPYSLYEQGSSHSYRQYHCGSIHKQRRGNEVGAPVCLTLEDPHLVHKKTGNPQSPTYPRSSQCDSRQIIPIGSDHPNRMVPQSGDFSSNMQLVAHPSSGSVCHKVQQQTPTVCVTRPRSPGLGSGCSQPVLGGTGPVCLPTSSHLGQSGGEVTGLPLQQDHLDCPMVAQHALVLGSSGTVQSDFLVPAQHTRLSVSTIQPGPTQDQPRRSTRSVYEAKWTIFTKWAPPLKVIADFLLHLFQDRKLQPGTIDGYKSAISDKLGNSTINVSYSPC